MYKLVGFQAPCRPDLNGYSFCISLDPEFAREAYAIKRPKDLSRFREVVNASLRNIKMDDFPARAIRFHENTILATNFTVAGNVCGLDIEWLELESVLSKEGYQPRYLTYYPHNIDSLVQAYALASIFSYWYEFAEAMVYAKKKGMLKCDA